MPELHARCSSQTKRQFQTVASGEGLTESILLRRIVATVITHNLDAVCALPKSDTAGQFRIGINNLIKKGMIYAPERGQIAFTVPLFDEFMRRVMLALRTCTALGRQRRVGGIFGGMGDEASGCFVGTSEACACFLIPSSAYPAAPVPGSSPCACRPRASTLT